MRQHATHDRLVSVRRVVPLLLLLALPGCRTRLLDEERLPVSVPCPDTKPTCVARPDACEPPVREDALCDVKTMKWSCPAGGRQYARAADSAASCLPFRHDSGILGLGAWGLGSFSRVPTDDGRCLWITDNAMLADGSKAQNVAFEPDRAAPFGTCPAQSVTPPRSIVTVEGAHDPSIIVQIDGGYRLGGATHVIYRLFRLDPKAVYGVTELGGGVGRWDGASQRIVIPDPEKPFPWGLDLDLGDAILDAGDGLHAWVWGCARPGLFLEQGCELARLDAQDNVNLLGADRAFLPTVDVNQGAILFGSGTWLSGVARVPGGLRHVYIEDFGRTLKSHTATSVTGPWSDGPSLGACQLPAADPSAMCAGPVIHDELADPTREGELPVSYSVGSTGPRVGTQDDEWARLIWAR